MRAAVVAIALLLLPGCLTYASGQAKRGELNCELLDVCGDLDTLGYDLASCKETAAAQDVNPDDCPDFDAGAMSACLDAYRAAIDAADCDADLSMSCDVCG